MPLTFEIFNLQQNFMFKNFLVFKAQCELLLSLEKFLGFRETNARSDLQGLFSSSIATLPRRDEVISRMLYNTMVMEHGNLLLLHAQFLSVFGFQCG